MTIRMAILDRDNTLVRVPSDKRYLYGTDPVDLLPEVGRALSYLNRRGIIVVVATNQQGISLEQFPQMTFPAVDLYNQRLNACLIESGAHIERFYVCPHQDADGCLCRKPKPGLVLQALSDYAVSSTDAVVIGNSQLDMDTATAEGVRAVAVPYPPGTSIRSGIFCCSTLLDAVRKVIGVSCRGGDAR